jgi:hypothetical protein
MTELNCKLAAFATVQAIAGGLVVDAGTGSAVLSPQWFADNWMRGAQAIGQEQIVVFSSLRCD